MESEALVTRGLTKRYGRTLALDRVDLTVRRGEVFGFLGPNGAGKTTFTKCVTGFIRPSAGTVHVLGIDVARDPVAVNAHVGLVPDQYDFYPNLTGREHLDFYARLNGIPAGEREARIQETLVMVGMTERADHRVKTYSHGMKQRICIAQAVLHRPEVILFDEPTNGLDPKGAHEMRTLIRSLASQGRTVFLSSHILPEVEAVCDRVAILDRGVIRSVGSVEDLRRRYATKGRVTLRLAEVTPALRAAAETALGAHVGVETGRLVFEADEGATSAVVAAVAAAGGRILEVHRETASLESAFLAVTDREAPR